MSSVHSGGNLPIDPNFRPMPQQMNKGTSDQRMEAVREGSLQNVIVYDKLLLEHHITVELTPPQTQVAKKVSDQYLNISQTNLPNLPKVKPGNYGGLPGLPRESYESQNSSYTLLPPTSFKDQPEDIFDEFLNSSSNSLYPTGNAFSTGGSSATSTSYSRAPTPAHFEDENSPQRINTSSEIHAQPLKQDEVKSGSSIAKVFKQCIAALAVGAKKAIHLLLNRNVIPIPTVGTYQSAPPERNDSSGSYSSLTLNTPSKTQYVPVRKPSVQSDQYMELPLAPPAKHPRPEVINEVARNAMQPQYGIAPPQRPGIAAGYVSTNAVAQEGNYQALPPEARGIRTYAQTPREVTTYGLVPGMPAEQYSTFTSAADVQANPALNNKPKEWNAALKDAKKAFDKNGDIESFTHNIVQLEKNIPSFDEKIDQKAARKEIVAAKVKLKHALKKFTQKSVDRYTNIRERHQLDYVPKAQNEIGKLVSFVQRNAEKAGIDISKTKEFKGQLEALKKLENQVLTKDEFAVFWKDASARLNDSKGTPEQNLAAYIALSASPWLNNVQADQMNMRAMSYFNEHVMPKLNAMDPGLLPSILKPILNGGFTVPPKLLEYMENRIVSLVSKRMQNRLDKVESVFSSRVSLDGFPKARDIIRNQQELCKLLHLSEGAKNSLLAKQNEKSDELVKVMNNNFQKYVANSNPYKKLAKEIMSAVGGYGVKPDIRLMARFADAELALLDLNEDAHTFPINSNIEMMRRALPKGFDDFDDQSVSRNNPGLMRALYKYDGKLNAPENKEKFQNFKRAFDNVAAFHFEVRKFNIDSNKQASNNTLKTIAEHAAESIEKTEDLAMFNEFKTFMTAQLTQAEKTVNKQK